MAGHDYDDIPDDVREDMAAERYLASRGRHWCETCHGHTGPSSPCYDGLELEDEPEGEDDADD